MKRLAAASIALLVVCCVAAEAGAQAEEAGDAAKATRANAAAKPNAATKSAADNANTPAKHEPPGVTALVRLAARPDLAKLKTALRQGADVNAQTSRGETALQAAATEGLTANVFTLLTSGAAIDMLGGRGITALGWAARGGHMQAVQTLLDAGAAIDLAASPDRSPIALAAAREHFAIVALLIDRHSKVFEDPALAGAVIRGVAQTTSVELVGLLVPRIAAMLPDAPALRDSVAYAAAGSSAAVSQAILARLGESGRSREFQTALLLAAIRRTRHDVASSAISAGADVNARSGTAGSPLAVAIDTGDASMVSMLMDAEADWHAHGIDQARLKMLAGSEVTDRTEAERRGKLGEIDRLDEDGTTLLFRAAQRGNFLSVKRILANGANPATPVKRWPGDEGWTPLMTAAAGNQIAVVRLLLERGAPVDQRNGAGRTALSYAAFYGRATVVDMLLVAGADPRAADDVGQTALLLANASGEPSTILRVAMALQVAGVAGGGAAGSGVAMPMSASGAAPATVPR